MYCTPLHLLFVSVYEDSNLWFDPAQRNHQSTVPVVMSIPIGCWLMKRVARWSSRNADNRRNHGVLIMVMDEVQPTHDVCLHQWLSLSSQGMRTVKMIGSETAVQLGNDGIGKGFPTTLSMWCAFASSTVSTVFNINTPWDADIEVAMARDFKALYILCEFFVHITQRRWDFNARQHREG